MNLTQEQATVLASLFSDCYQPPEVNRVAVTTTGVRRQVPTKVKVKRPQERSEVVDEGVSPTVLIVAAAGAIIAVLMGIFVSIALMTFVLAAVAVGGFLLGQKYRSTKTRVVTSEVEVEETQLRDVEEASQVDYRDVAVPNPRRVVTIGRVSLRFLALPLHGKTLLLDPHGVVPAANLTVDEPEQPIALHTELSRVETLTRQVDHVLHGESAEFSVAEPTAVGSAVVLRGQERELFEAYGNVSAALERVRAANFTVHAVSPDDKLWSHLRRGPGRAPISASVLEARRLLEAMASPQGDILDRRLKGCRVRWRATQKAFDTTRNRTLRGAVSTHCRNLGVIFHYSAFNFYCPTCNATLQQELLARDYTLQGDGQQAPVQYSRNTRCLYDPERDRWRCPACEASTSRPIPIHRMLDDVLFPTYDRLMEENKNARLAAYADARARETAFTNSMEAEVEQLFQRNREILESLHYDLQRSIAEVEGENAAIAAFRNVMESHKVAQSEALAQTLKEHRQVIARTAQDRQMTATRLDEVFTREREAMVRVMRECSRSQYLENRNRDEVLRQVAAGVAHTAANTGVMVQQGDASGRKQDQMIRLQSEAVVEQRHGNAMAAATLMAQGGTREDVQRARMGGSLR